MIWIWKICSFPHRETWKHQSSASQVRMRLVKQVLKKLNRALLLVCSSARPEKRGRAQRTGRTKNETAAARENEIHTLTFSSRVPCLPWTVSCVWLHHIESYASCIMQKHSILTWYSESSIVGNRYWRGNRNGKNAHRTHTDSVTAFLLHAATRHRRHIYCILFIVLEEREKCSERE